MLRELWYRLRSVIGRVRMDREMEEELRDHVERETARNVERGMDPAEARRRALISFGGLERFGAAARDELRSRPLEDFVDDVRYALRALVRSPVFAAIAVLSLGLGVGANTAIFSIVDGVLLKPLPYPESDRLVLLGVEFHGQNAGTSASDADLQALAGARGFESVGAHYRSRTGVTWTGAGEAEMVSATWVTPGLFAALGVAPALGRFPNADEGAPGSARVVMMSHEFWRDRFDGARDALGRTMMLDGDAYTIVGVMPPGFRVPGLPADALWPVLQMAPAESRSPFWLTVIARRSEGVPEAQTASELARIRDEVSARFPENTGSWSYSETPLQDVLVRDMRATILVLFGAVVLVLVIAAANVANLLLARATARAPELAVRSALGAGQGRLIRQLVTEGLVLAGLGAAVGVALAYGGLGLLASLTPGNLPRFHEVGLDGRVLLFTASVALLTGVLVGIVPALRIPGDGLREAGRGGAAGRERVTLRSALVVAEFALALTVLIGAALLGNSLIRLQNVDPGSATNGVLAVRLGLPQTGYEEPDVAQFFDGLLTGVRALPGVEAAAVSMAVPPHRIVMRNPFTPEGRTYGPGDAPPLAHQLLVTPDYFSAIGAPLLRGRDFSAADGADAPLVAIIDETMARRYYGDGDPVGRTIQLGEPDPGSPRVTIVGVAPNVRYAGLELDREPTVYVPYAQNLWWRTMYLVVRSAGDPRSLLPAIRARVAALDPQVPVREVRTIDELMREAVAQPRFRTVLLGSFAGLALLLAAAGIYGVMSYSVQQRRREMSIRLALGARRHEIIGMVVRRGLILAAGGAMLGIAMAAALSGLLRSILFGVQALDPVTFAAAAGFLLTVALAASLLPAIRASRAQPAATLRSE